MKVPMDTRHHTTPHQAPDDLPTVSPRLFRLFTRYTNVYLRRAFHAVRLTRDSCLTWCPDVPTVIYLNHPAWWDPLLCLFLASRLFPTSTHYAPMEAEALARYRLFTRLGFFGITPGTRRGAVTFLRVSTAILRQSGTILWLTPTGRFVDPRARPITLQPGIAYLARRAPQAQFVPLALEYPFWQERFPEALAHFGTPLTIDDMQTESASDVLAQLGAHLTTAQDTLAHAACQQNPELFTTLLAGNAGVGGVYDVWRALRARLGGGTFRKTHGTEVV